MWSFYTCVSYIAGKHWVRPRMFSLAFGHHQTSRTLLGTKACCNDRPQTHAGIGKANQAREAKNNERTVWYTYIIIYIYYTVYYSMAIYDYIWISLSLSVPRRFQSSRGKCFWMFFSAAIPFAAARLTTSATEVPTAPSSAERIPKQHAKNWVSCRNRRSPAEECELKIYINSSKKRDAEPYNSKMLSAGLQQHANTWMLWHEQRSHLLVGSEKIGSSRAAL